MRQYAGSGTSKVATLMVGMLSKFGDGAATTQKVSESVGDIAEHQKLLCSFPSPGFFLGKARIFTHLQLTGDGGAVGTDTCNGSGNTATWKFRRANISAAHCCRVLCLRGEF